MTITFKERVNSINSSYARRIELETLQVNMGNMCNQSCLHCHVGASRSGDKVMTKAAVDDIIKFLSGTKGLILDITGGCPELNPHFKYFVTKVRSYVKQIMVRSNLTVLFEPGMETLPEFYKDKQVKLVCSMPCYTKEKVEAQRGKGVFDKSITALKLLNSVGYGQDKGLELDLVYNPGGAFLPGDQAGLEKDYKRELGNYGVVFKHLITITNAPINRFEQYLKANGNYDEYMKLLVDSFNKEVVPNIMCRNLLSVAWDGKIYDCDFNQARGLALKNSKGEIMAIGDLGAKDLEDKEIIFDNHCYCCTAGAGSSCQGALASYT